MFSSIGRRFIQGAKAEIEENPPVIFDQERIVDIVKLITGLGVLAMIIFGKGRGSVIQQPQNIIINNYINGVKAA